MVAQREAGGPWRAVFGGTYWAGGWYTKVILDGVAYNLGSASSLTELVEGEYIYYGLEWDNPRGNVSSLVAILSTDREALAEYLEASRRYRAAVQRRRRDATAPPPGSEPTMPPVKNPAASAAEPYKIAERWQELWEMGDEEGEEYNWTNYFDARDVARRLGAELGLPVLGVGSNRAALALDENRIIKLPFWHGDEQNLWECSRWQNASARLATALVPVLACDGAGQWIVMRRAAPIDRAAADASSRMSGPMAIVHEAGLEDVYDPENWGVLDGRVVMVDYGEMT